MSGVFLLMIDEIKLLPVIVLILGIIIIYLYRRKIMPFLVSRGVSLFQKIILKVFLSVNDREPEWILVKFQAKKKYLLGLLCQEGEDKATIFIPSGPRFFPGETVFMDNNQWRELDLSFEEGMRMLITFGLTDESRVISEKIWNKMEDF